MQDEHWDWFNGLDERNAARHLERGHGFVFSEDDPHTAEEAHDNAHFEEEADDQRRASRTFDDGMKLGVRIEHNVAVTAVVTALLQILGKDPGDGPIDLGAAGTWFAGSGDHAQAHRVEG